MTLIQLLNKETNKENLKELILYTNLNEDRFKELMTLFFTDKKRLSQKSAWLISFSAQNQPQLLLPYFKKMIHLLKGDSPMVIIRNIVRTLQWIDIPENLLGETFDICYEFVAKVETPIAVKAFSMTILYNICVKEPDLKNEIIELIKIQMENGSKGIQSRGRKILKQLAKLS